jgi:hypothetical protein
MGVAAFVKTVAAIGGSRAVRADGERWRERSLPLMEVAAREIGVWVGLAMEAPNMKKFLSNTHFFCEASNATGEAAGAEGIFSHPCK